jgi:hypothetical protein
VGIGHLIVQWIVGYGIYKICQSAYTHQISNLLFEILVVKYLSINFKKEDKENELVHIINNDIVPSIPAIRKELEIIIVLNEHAQ